MDDQELEKIVHRTRRGQREVVELDLNRRGVPSLGSTWNRSKRRCRGWVHTGVRAILKNERYTGKLIWNRTKWIKVPFTSKCKCITRPRDEWVIREIPALRIVSDSLAAKVQARFDEPLFSGAPAPGRLGLNLLPRRRVRLV